MSLTRGSIASPNTSLTSKPPAIGRYCRRLRPGSWPARVSSTRPEPSHRSPRGIPRRSPVRAEFCRSRQLDGIRPQPLTDARSDRLLVALLFDSRCARVSRHLRRDRAEAAEQIDRHAGWIAIAASHAVHRIEAAFPMFVTLVYPAIRSCDPIRRAGTTRRNPSRHRSHPCAPNTKLPRSCCRTSSSVRRIPPCGGDRRCCRSSAASTTLLLLMSRQFGAHPSGRHRCRTRPAFGGVEDGRRAECRHHADSRAASRTGSPNIPDGGDLLPHRRAAVGEAGIGFGVLVELEAAERRAAETFLRRLVVVVGVEIEHAAIRAAACRRRGTGRAPGPPAIADARRQRRGRTASLDRVRTAAARGRRCWSHAVEVILIARAVCGHDAELPERPVTELHAFAIAPVDAEHDVAAAFGDIVPRVRSALLISPSALAGLRNIGADRHAFEIALHHEIDRTGDRVRAV